MELSAKLEMQTSSHGAFELKGFTTTTPEPTAKLGLLNHALKSRIKPRTHGEQNNIWVEKLLFRGDL